MTEGFLNNTFAMKDVLVAVCAYGWVMNQYVEVIPVNLVWFRKLSGSGLDEVNVPLSNAQSFPNVEFLGLGSEEGRRDPS